MLQTNFDPFPILTTERLVLRPLKITDAEEIFIHRNDEVVNTYLENFRHRDIEDSIAFIERVQREIAEGRTIMWVITGKGNDRFMGTVCFWQISKEAHSAETGYTLLSEFHGKRYMNEALARILNYGLDVMVLRYVDAYTYQHNIASIKLLTKNGFKPGKPQKAVSTDRVYYYKEVVPPQFSNQLLTPEQMHQHHYLPIKKIYKKSTGNLTITNAFLILRPVNLF